ncbi:MAG: hypothetical protein ABW328_00755 [Ilumatobacteraceae bacterium]
MSSTTFIPKLIPAFVLAGVAAGALGLGTVGAASGADDARIVLEQLCQARGGTPYATPYSIIRCQFARANKGFETEQAVCVGLADGEFILALGTAHMNRASWGCSPTAPPA